MWSYLLDNRLITLHEVLVLIGLAVYVIGSRTRHQRRHPSAAIAWVVSLALMPYIALPLYLLFGSRKVGRGAGGAKPGPGTASPFSPNGDASLLPPTDNALRLSAAGNAAASPPTGNGLSLPQGDAVRTPFQQLALAMGLPEVTTCHDLALHEDGAQALHALRAVLQSANRTLDVSTFLIGHDRLGRELLDTLMQRVREGVRVRLLVDGIGVYLGGRIDARRLRAAGVQVAMFVSPFRSGLPGRTNLRNHRKLVIADGCRTWCGGRNMAAEYFTGDPGHARRIPWIDLTFDFTGPLARQTQQRFDADWAFATGTPLRDPVAPEPALPSPAPPEPALPTPTSNEPVHPTPASKEPAQPEPALLNPVLVDPVRLETPAGRALASATQLIASGPDQRDDTFYTLLVTSCFAARSRILAVTPYFVPDAVLLMALTLAARRQVQVDLVLPRHSNHRLADHARHPALRELTAAGGRVWLVPGMVHAKAIVIDANLALAGSANLDERSLFLNYELMIAFFDAAQVARFANWIERHRASAERYRGQRPGLLREIGEGVVRWLAFQL